MILRRRNKLKNGFANGPSYLQAKVGLLSDRNVPVTPSRLDVRYDMTKHKIITFLRTHTCRRIHKKWKITFTLYVSTYRWFRKILYQVVPILITFYIYYVIGRFRIDHVLGINHSNLHRIFSHRMDQRNQTAVHFVDIIFE